MAVDRWLEGRFRKLARRARGARWAAVQELEGVSVSHRGAEVRAFPPAPTDELAPLLSKLQLSGPEPEVADTVTDLPAARPDPATPLLVICLSTLPPLGLGKAAAAAGHVSQIALMNADPGLSSAWREGGFPLVVVEPYPQVFTSLVSSSPVVVRDAGFTEVPSGTITAVGYWL